MPAVRPSHPELVATYQGYSLVRHRGWLFGVPQLAGPVDLNLEEECRHAGVLRGRTWDELRARIDAELETPAVPIEFAGWLPIFMNCGNCGRHPQFKHTATPPPGYRFTCSSPLHEVDASPWRKRFRALQQGLGRVLQKMTRGIRPFFALFRGVPGVSWRERLRILLAVVRLFRALRRDGGKLGPVLQFLQSRHYQSQLLLAHQRGPVFLPSVPFTYGQNPWLVEIEDPTTLFYPLIQNGGTQERSLADSTYFPILKTLLEANACRGIITHMQSTARMVKNLFRSETIRAKVFHTPLGVPLPGRWQRHDGAEATELIHLLFTNSWHQMPGNFFLRGGLDVLEAFDILHERYPQLRLTLRTHVPGMEVRYHRILEQRWVRVIDRFTSAREMETLLSESHIYLLPAARVHIVSLLQAMAHGLAVVTSDGWGFDEYVEPERNGLIVPGRYGQVSWVDEEAAMLREDYAPMYEPNPQVVEGIVHAVSRLVEDRALRQRLGRTARHDVETRYSVARWNAGLKAIFDQVLP